MCKAATELDTGGMLEEVCRRYAGLYSNKNISAASDDVFGEYGIVEPLYQETTPSSLQCMVLQEPTCIPKRD